MAFRKGCFAESSSSNGSCKRELHEPRRALVVQSSIANLRPYYQVQCRLPATEWSITGMVDQVCGRGFADRQGQAIHIDTIRGPAHGLRIESIEFSGISFISNPNR